MPLHDSPHWLDPHTCTVAELDALVRAPTQHADYPLASAITQGVPVYDGAQIRGAGPALQRDLMAEWCRVWQGGPGVLVLQAAFADLAVVDAATAAFHRLIAAERLTGTRADHFAKPGANDRVWNALEKLCLAAPPVFAAYYGNPLLAWVCEAWLGPAYQVTSQINSVNPGGAAQMAHRDYHLGFLSPAQAARYPAHVHQLSPALTLQGAVAHVDMPVESGPTLYLPHSQKYPAGYLVAGQPAFQAYFDAQHVQLPLRKGDAVFFNPALMHAAGHNRSADIYRMANLLQVSSAFGRAMESVDRLRMCEALYPALRGMPAAEQVSAVAACAEGYAFPTNLDRDPPLGGLAPESQQAVLLRALQEGWPVDQLHQALRQQAEKKWTH
ncbi:Ectoine hydroxylase-related dioxygenase, phytanoyl-CoA dioxygenase (PhyH) family [Rhodoferax sp. OV413]|uniref:phytanoyl-CoA dioxygenase family protein n=1 Tax=Rhodoferax sp. OV413 TaxID=1855285 RepID=UPI000880D390|nr:phytanoyl-CoA dioxygenase family protein [Rhodoferax sp. OV413]SDP38917.1 Ectoine hydroxylase-related dioxygenase, phytanoyl-CoA dioxygenase (PhyH) family [Rhodoferax sp. OV413]